MALHLKIIGMLLIALGSVHVIFPKYFNWKDELERLSLINRQVMRVHTFFIALTVSMMGLLCLTSTQELLQSSLGRKISLGFGIFWVCRLFIQLFGYSSQLWRGKKFETIVHLVFTLTWVYFCCVFLIIGFR